MSLIFAITISDIDSLSDKERNVLMSILGVSRVELSAAAVEPVVPAPVVLPPTYFPDAPLPPVSIATPVLPPTKPSFDFVPPTQPPVPVETDVRGLPWDIRIHSKERTKNQDGSWRNKRGVDVVTLTTVETELKNLMSIPAAQAVVPALASSVAPIEEGKPVPQAAYLDLPVRVPVEVPEAPAPSVPSVPTPPAPPAAPVAPTAPTAPIVTADSPFAAFMTRITPLIAAKKLTQEIIVGVVQKHSLPHLHALVSRPDLIPQVEADLVASVEGGAQ